MEVRFFKKSEKQLLLDSIDRLWRHNHVYVRQPEVLEHLVLNTPYRADFAGEDNYSFAGIWDDEGNVVGLEGAIPHHFNVFGDEVMSRAGTIWIVDKTVVTRVNGIVLDKFLEEKIKVFAGFGGSKDFMRVYKAYGADMVENFPRWIGINKLDESLKYLLPKSTNKFLLPMIVKNEYKGNFIIEYDKLNKEKWDEFYYNDFAPITIGTQKDYTWLNWRYMESPVLKYNFITISNDKDNYVGLAVIRKEKILDDRYEIGRILEFISLDAEASLVLANTIVKFMPEAIMFDFYCLSDITAFGLESIGFRKIPLWSDSLIMPTRFKPIDYEMLKLNGAVYMETDVRNKINVVNTSQWYITRGDGDQDRAN